MSASGHFSPSTSHAGHVGIGRNSRRGWHPFLRAVREGTAEDKNAVLIADALQPLIEQNKLRIPRGGYVVRRGRGKVIVEPPAE